MPEYITQWTAEYLPSVMFSFALWTLGAAAAGFLAGLLLFLLLRLIGLYRMKFQLGGLVAILLFIYTAVVTTAAFGIIGFFESAKRQTDKVLASPQNQQMLGELSGALSSRATSLAYAYGIQTQATGETKPDFPALVQEINSFDKDQWGIDLEKSDRAFDQITDEVVQENYQSIYGLIFKDVTGDKGSNLNLAKTVLDRFIKPEKLTGKGLTKPLRTTLSQLETKRQNSGQVYATELKAHAGEKTSYFLTNKVGLIIRSQQLFFAVIAAIALAISMILVFFLQLIIKSQSSKQPA